MTAMVFGIFIIFVIRCLTIIPINALHSDVTATHSEITATDSKMIPKDCSVCGISPQKEVMLPLIVGGSPVKELNTYPWMVRVEPSYCAGAILNEFYILTAAHCVMEDNKLQNTVILFQIRSQNPEEGLSREFATDEIIVHPKYRLVDGEGYTLAKYDIALVKLKKRIKCDEYKNTICLPDENFNISPDARSIIAGWGKTDFHYDDKPMILRHGSVKHVDFEECIKTFPKAEKMKDHMLCVGGTNRTACSGDSGGPLVHKFNGKYYVIGVASSSSCEIYLNTVTIYTDVLKFLDWIKEKMKSPTLSPVPTERIQGKKPSYTGYASKTQKCTRRKTERKQKEKQCSGSRRCP